MFMVHEEKARTGNVRLRKTAGLQTEVVIAVKLEGIEVESYRTWRPYRDSDQGRPADAATEIKAV